jgi:hypothetical protein
LSSCDSTYGWFTPAFLDEIICPLVRSDFNKEKIDNNPNKRRTALSWREFLDVAAVADLTVRILDTTPGRPNKRCKEGGDCPSNAVT